MAKQTMTFTVEANVPDGWEMTGELRPANTNEWFLNSAGDAEQARNDLWYHRIILRPAPKWRPATIADAVRAIKGETVKARGPYGAVINTDCWEECQLVGYDTSEANKWIGPDKTYRICEVLDV